MSQTITLCCWVFNTPTKQIFPVEIGRDEMWCHVKDEIKEKQRPVFDDIDANNLDLWKVTIGRSQLSSLKSESLKRITTTDSLCPIDSLSTDLSVPLPDDQIDVIIVLRPTPFNLASSKLLISARLARTYSWLICAQRYSIVDINAAALEAHLTKLHPDRHSETYAAKEVLSVKREVLRSFKPPSIGAATHATNSTHPGAESNENNDVDGELYSLFPFTIEYLDLARLKLETAPEALLICQEYKFIIEQLADLCLVLFRVLGLRYFLAISSHSLWLCRPDLLNRLLESGKIHTALVGVYRQGGYTFVSLE